MILRTVLFLAAALFFAGLFLPGPAAAQENSLYTVSGVHVDATGASSTEALNAAIAQGRARAWQTLYRRLTRQVDWPRQPALEAAELVRIGRGYNIANERRSTTRYVADVTYMFNPASVARTSGSISSTTASVARIIGSSAFGCSMNCEPSTGRPLAMSSAALPMARRKVLGSR